MTVNKCTCGTAPKLFGEALMVSVTCDACDEHVSYVGRIDIVAAWNSGLRGCLTDSQVVVFNVKQPPFTKRVAAYDPPDADAYGY